MKKIRMEFAGLPFLVLCCDTGYYKVYDFFDGRAGTFTGDFFPKVLNLGIAAFQGKGNRVGNLVSDFAFRDTFLYRYCP